MRYCRFCGDIEREPLTFCKKCGYSLKEFPISKNGKTDVEQITKDKISQIGFIGRGSPFSEAEYKEITFAGYRLYEYWEQLHSAYQHNSLNYEATADTLTLYTSLQGDNNILSCDNFPSHIPSTIVFTRELCFDRTDPSTGYRIYESERRPQGSLSVDSLSQDQRIRFLKWFLSTYPHATPKGTLCFEF